jgi:hypothetical protein
MYEITVVVAVVLLLASAIHYAKLAWQKPENPVLGTWILIAVMISLSFWMYWVSPKKSWTGNIGVTGGFLNIWIILFGVVFAKMRKGILRIAFDRLQKVCLAGGVIIVIFWFLTKEPLISYILVQIIGLVAYVATVKKLWNAPRTTEPLFLWSAVLFANLCAVYPAFVRDDTFSWIYLARAIPSTTGVVFMIARLKWKSGELF